MPPDGAGFCVSCGRPLAPVDGPGAAGAGPGVATAIDGGEPATMAVAGEPAISESAVSRGNPQSRNAVVAGLAVVALCLAVVLIRPDGGSGDEAPENVEPPPSSVPGDEVVQPDGGGGRGGPFLGSVVGWSLLATSPGGTTVIDLDRSTAEDSTIEGRPLAVVGDRLLLDRSDLAVAVPLADPTAPAIELASYVFRVMEVDERRAWLATFDPSNGSMAWHLIDVTTGESEQVVAGGWARFSLVVHPELSTTPAGGVWARVGDRDVQVSDGRLLAADQDVALLSTCSAPDSCQRQWFNRFTWGPVDLPVPENMFSASEILGSRVLVHHGWSAPRFHDLVRDRDIDPPVEGHHYAISADGRYLVVGAEDGSLWLLDLDSERRWDLAPLMDDSGPSRFIESVLFVETSALTPQS